MLLAENKPEFMDQVNKDIRGTASDEVAAALREPENVDRWILALLEIKRNTESQLSSFRSEVVKLYQDNTNPTFLKRELDKRYRWRADVIRVKNGAENRLDEAKLLKYSEVKRLREAIETHKENMLYAGENEDTEKFDDELWSVLDG